MSKNLQYDHSPVAYLRCEPIIDYNHADPIGTEFFGVPWVCVHHHVTPDQYFDALARSPEKSIEYDLAVIKKLGLERIKIPELGKPGFMSTVNISYASLLAKDAANRFARSLIQAGFRFHDITPEIAEPRHAYSRAEKLAANHEIQKLLSSGISVIVDDAQQYDDPRLVPDFFHASSSRKLGQASVIGCKLDHHVTANILKYGLSSRHSDTRFIQTLEYLRPDQVIVCEGTANDRTMLCLTNILNKASQAQPAFQGLQLGAFWAQRAQTIISSQLVASGLNAAL